jgi:hypothetical protein
LYNVVLCDDEMMAVGSGIEDRHLLEDKYGAYTQLLLPNGHSAAVNRARHGARRVLEGHSNILVPRIKRLDCRHELRHLAAETLLEDVRNVTLEPLGAIGWQLLRVQHAVPRSPYQVLVLQTEEA